MNIEEERKAFEALYKPCDRIAFCFGLKKYVQLSREDNDSEIVDHANQCWELWQAAKAQAVPEGFVLVPTSLSDEQYNQLEEVLQDNFGTTVSQSRDCIAKIHNELVSIAQEQKG